MNGNLLSLNTKMCKIKQALIYAYNSNRNKKYYKKTRKI